MANFIHNTSYLADVAYLASGRLRKHFISLKGFFESRKPHSGLNITHMTAAVTSICNANCIFCNYGKTSIPRGVMSLDIFTKSLALAKKQGIRTIDLTPVVGDSLVNPHIVEFIRLAAAEGFEVSLTTNAIEMRSALLNGLIESGLKRIFISTPGFCVEEYQSVFAVDVIKASKALNGIEDFLTANRKAGYPILTRIYVRNRLAPRHIMRMPFYKDVVKPHLGDFVTQTFTPYWDGWGGAIKDEDMFASMKIMKLKLRPVPCASLGAWSVLWDGTVRNCGCRFVKTDHDDLVIGNVNDSVEDLRQKSYMMRQRFLTGDYPDTCKNCSMYNPKI